MRRAITSPVTRVGQRGDIAPIGFDASAALAIHGRECRIGHNDLVAEGLKVLRDPLALGGRFQQNSHRPPSFEHGREPVARRRDPSVDHLATVRDDPDLAFFLWRSMAPYSMAGFLLVRRERVSHCGAQATTLRRGPAASSYLRACLCALPIVEGTSPACRLHLRVCRLTLEVGQGCHVVNRVGVTRPTTTERTDAGRHFNVNVI